MTDNPAAVIVPELLTSREAAELLAIGKRTLWRWSRSGRAPSPVNIGDGPRAAVRYSRGELVAWINAGCPHIQGPHTPQ